MKVFITGMGIISSLGHTTQQNLDSLISKKDGLGRISDIKGIRKEFIGGQVNITNKELEDLAKVKVNMPVQRATFLAAIAAREAWADRDSTTGRNGVIYGTTVGSFDTGGPLVRKMTDPNIPIDFQDLNEVSFATDLLADLFKLFDYRATLSTACSTAANAILLGARLIKAGMLDRVLVGGAEEINNYNLCGFDSLMLYDENKCKPFDENRNGLNLGEAGAFLVLESEKCAAKNGAGIIGELVGWANTCDAYHITASSPEGTGAGLAMEKALKMASLTPAHINYINAHGTGTPNNDASESQAIQKVFGDSPPPFGSTKSYTGHTLAAAGGVEAIFSMLSLKHNLIFPNLRFHNPISEAGITPVNELISGNDIKYVLSNSFGFGGNCTSLIFSA